MNLICKAILAIAAATLPATALAAGFEPIPRSYYPEGYDLVDSLLISDKVLGTAPKAGEVYYSKDVTLDPIRTSRGSYLFQPRMYYIISSLPGNAGRYYGFYSAGHNNLGEVLSGNAAAGTTSDYSLVYGTVIRPDGTREDVVIRPESEWKKLDVGKPAGTFYIHDYSSQIQMLELTFNAGGTGKATFYMPRSTHQAPQEISGMSTQRNANGTVKKRHRSFSGGYYFYLDGKATVNMKWSIADGKLTITPVGTPVTGVTGGIDEDKTWARQEITESDKRIENGKHRADFPTNEYVKKAKNRKLEALKEYMADMGGISFNVRHVTKNEILMGNKSENFPGTYYFMADRNKNGDGFVTYALDNLKNAFSQFSKSREFGADRLYQVFVNNAQVGIGMAPAPLGDALTYQVTDINPFDRTGTIHFIVPGKVYKANLGFDNRWHVDNALLQSSLEENTDIADAAKTIAANHDRIMGYKSDKRRAKIVKNYEKTVKNADIGTSFSTLEDYQYIQGRQKVRLEYQERILKELE